MLYVCVSTSSAQELRNVFSYEAKEDFGEQIVYVEKIDSIKRFEKTVIDGHDSKVPFYHYINKLNTGKFVILLHGLNGSKDDWKKSELLDSLLSTGYNVIIPDAKFHGERSYELNFRPAGTLPPGWSKSRKDAKIFYDLYSATIKDIRIIMDYFEKQQALERPQFDLVGYSMGGAISLIINAVDPRVNCVAACVPPVNRPITEIKDYGWPDEIVSMLKDMTPMYYTKFQNSPVALFMGATDFFTSEAEANQFFDEISLRDKYLKFYEAGHGLPSEYQYDVVDWLIKHNSN